MTQPFFWSVGVVVPAQNEEATIGKCVDSILRSHEACARSKNLWVVVVADDCTDRTVERARRRLGGSGEVLECRARSPGTARGLGAAAVMQHFGTADASRIWLANTDADSHVPLDWIDGHLAHADDDAGGVAGIVALDESGGIRQDISNLYQDTYTISSDGSHTHVHGANLGVRADAYLDVGGWSQLASAEDHCLWGRLQLRGWRLTSPSSSVVHTSARLHGRAVGGFADTLRARLDDRA